MPSGSTTRKNVFNCVPSNPTLCHQRVVSSMPKLKSLKKPRTTRLQTIEIVIAVRRTRVLRCLRVDNFYRLIPDSPHLPGVVRNDQAHQPIDKRCTEHQHDEPRLGPAVKCVSGNDQPGVTPALPRAKQRVINEQREGQKIVDENVRTKYHARYLLLFSAVRL